MLSNLSEKASSPNLKSLTQKTKNGATIMFPEGLEDTPFKMQLFHYLTYFCHSDKDN